MEARVDVRGERSARKRETGVCVKPEVVTIVRKEAEMEMFV